MRAPAAFYTHIHTYTPRKTFNPFIVERVNGLEWKRVEVCVRRSISFQFYPRNDKSHWLTTGLRYVEHEYESISDLSRSNNSINRLVSLKLLHGVLYWYCIRSEIDVHC